MSRTPLMAPSLLLGVLLTSLPVSAAPPMTGTWRINGNGYLSGMGLTQDAAGYLQGSMYGDDAYGYHASGPGHAVLLRGPRAAPTQAYVGEVDSAGNFWGGVFYALTPGMGATASRHVFGFTARRQPVSYVYYSTPSTGGATNNCLLPTFTVSNRPSEYGNNWTFLLRFDNPAPPFGCITGSVTGTIAGDPFYGHYSPGSGSLVLLRMNGGLPAQFYVAQVSTPFLGKQSLSGNFHALTVSMGAGSTRMRYDWTAQSQ